MTLLGIDDLDELFEKFCAALKLDPNRWASVFEFTVFMDFQFTDFLSHIDNPVTDLSPPAMHKLQLLNSPHAHTMFLIHKAKRATLTGRIKTKALVMVQLSQFSIAIVRAVLKRIKEL